MKHFHVLGLHSRIIKKTSKVGDDTRQQQMVRFKAHQAYVTISKHDNNKLLYNQLASQAQLALYIEGHFHQEYLLAEDSHVHLKMLLYIKYSQRNFCKNHKTTKV